MEHESPDRRTNPRRPAPTPPTRAARSCGCLTGLFGTVAAAVLGVPVVGYFFGLRKYRKYWVDLGPLADFPLNETRRLDLPQPAGASRGTASPR